MVTLVAACAAGLSAHFANAQIPIGQEQTFTGAAPPLTSFSSRSIAGAGGAIATAVDMDAAVQTNSAAEISTALATSTAAAPGATAQAIWTSGAGSGGMLVTRPTGNSYTILKGTVTNSTGMALSSVVISYVFGMPSALAGEDAELAGHRVYYSTTGLAGSWTLIPELTSATPTPVPGNLLHTLTVSIPANGLLYLLWVDDNGGPAGDGSFSIDNLLVSTAIPCPVITQQPANVNTFQNRTISFSVVATGPGLTYQWNRVGFGPLSDGPTGTGATVAGANSATLVITNVQSGDTGDYFVVVSNPCIGGPVTSATAHLEVNVDVDPPQFVGARGGADAFTFIVSFNEVICSDPACGYDSGVYTFVWTVQNADNPAEDLSVSAAVPSGTNVMLTVQIAATPGARYRISVLNSGPGSGFYVTDLAGNAMPDASFVITSPTVTFQQGANGYTGTQDAGIHSGAGIDTPDPANPIINVDGDDGGIRQALLRFDTIIGSGAGQIPLGARINTATLTLNQTDNGNPVNFHRMLVTWDQTTATWNLLGGGLTADGVEAATAVDFVTPGLNGVVGAITMDVTASVQAWVAGQPNYGWAIIPTGGDGWRWNASEIGGAAAPLLLVNYDVVPCTTMPSISVQPPATASVVEGSALSIAVGISNACGTVTNQWKKGGVNVPGQTNQNLTIANAAPSDAGSYTLEVKNENGTATSTAVALTVIPDPTRPVLTRAVSTSSTTIVLNFNKQLASSGAGSATLTSHYTLSGGATVSAAALSNGANNATVTLTTSARGITTTTLTITGVTDNRQSLNLINPNPTVVAVTGVSVPAGAEWGGSWSYNTNNLDGTPTWKDVGFVPGVDWLTGNALFGTEPDAGIIALFPVPIATVIPPNSTAPGDFVTVYFRKTVTLPALAAGSQYLLDHFIDDGAVFYWDGVEFARYNMPAGSITYTNKAAAAVEGSHQSVTLPASANAGGTHTLAIEVHQGGATTSSDVLFAAQIVAVPTAGPSLSIRHNIDNGGINNGTNVVSWTADSRWRLVRATVVSGPYAVVGGNPFHSFIVLPVANTNSAFFQLQHNPNP